MKDLSLVQEYMLCAVNEKGKISGLQTERLVCFVAAGILDLQLEGCLAVEGKLVRTAAPLPEARRYLQPLYDYISQKKTVKLTAAIEAYQISFTDKRMRELTEAVGDSLVGMGMAEERETGLLGRRKGYVPGQEAVRSVVEMLRAEVLEEGEMTEEAAALAILLERAKCLKLYFSPFEQKEMAGRIKALVSSPEGRVVKELVDHIEALMAAAAASVSAAASAGSV